MTPLAVIGSLALWLTFLWLGSAIAASWLSERKGYGERAGLASGLLLNVLGVVVWLLWPPKPDSRWRVQGPLGGRDRSRAEPHGEVERPA